MGEAISRKNTPMLKFYPLLVLIFQGIASLARAPPRNDALEVVQGDSVSRSSRGILLLLYLQRQDISPRRALVRDDSAGEFRLCC